MKPFQAIRYLNNVKVRAVYDYESYSWWYSAMDVMKALTSSDNSRRYWNTFKVRHFYNFFLYKKLKVRSNDLKMYKSDVLKEEGIALLVKLLPKNHIISYDNVYNEIHISFDEFISNRCNHLYDMLMIDPSLIYCYEAVLQIQCYLFDSLDNHDKLFIDPESIDADYYVKEILLSINCMDNKRIEDLINKFIELILLKPFNKGNLISGLIWLDLMIRTKYKKCICYNNIDKEDLLLAIELSPREPRFLYDIIKSNLSSQINDLKLREETIKFVKDVGNN